MWEWSTTLEGIRPISKKNSRRNFGHVSLPSKAFENFKKLMLEEIENQVPTEPFDTDFTLYFDLYLKGRIEMDLDNAETSILDVLADAGVIANDKQMIHHQGSKFRGHPDWRIDIRLVERISEVEEYSKNCDDDNKTTFAPGTAEGSCVWDSPAKPHF